MHFDVFVVHPCFNTDRCVRIQLIIGFDSYLNEVGDPEQFSVKIALPGQIGQARCGVV